MAEGLTAYVRAAMARPWVWGEWDCMHFAVGWVEHLAGRDLSGAWVGACEDEAGAAALVRRHGGMVALMDKVLAGVLRRCDPEEAMIGVIEDAGGALAAIRSGRSWLVLTERGVGRTARAPVIAAWGF